MSRLILIRGLPGSGKSTMAETFEDFIHIETDMYFIKNGEYCFNPKKLKEAHTWCQEKTKELLDEGYDVVVSNVFTQMWEMKPYLNMGHSIQIFTATGNYDNIHHVPEEAIQRMKDKWEEFL